jgi:hypothetical protein
MKLVQKIRQNLDERRRLRSRTALQIALADRFSQLNAESWQAVTRGGSFFHSLQYQAAFERFCPLNIEPRYALICDGDVPLATLCMQVVRVDLQQVGKGSGNKDVEKLRRLVQQRMLVCGNLLAYGLHGVCFAPNADRDKVWPAVAEALYRTRRAEKLAGHADLVLIKDLDEVAVEESRALEKLSYASVPTEPNMVLAMHPKWRSHDDYLQSLTAKFRGDIKNRVFKKFNDAGCVIEKLTDVPGSAAELQNLYLQVHANATLRPFVLPPSYWQVLSEVAGANAVIHVARQGERRIGFIVSLKDADTMFAYHVGFDRAAADCGIPVYLRLLHASLAQALEFGCRRVSFGRTALEAKARMGCQPESTFIWARHRHPLLNQVLLPLLNLIDPEQAPPYTPFKDSIRQ